MPPTVTVFLDTSVLKASADTRLVFRAEPQKVFWWDREIEVNIHRPIYVNQNVKFLKQGNRERFEDTLSLRYVAALAKEQKIALLSHPEVTWELMGLPRSNGRGPRFYGAPIHKIKGPIQYERTLVDFTGHDYQLKFLTEFKHPRFLELQRVCGAFQGHDRPRHRNQLIDAFHLLCAESAGANYFLTLDNKLIRTLANQKTQKTNVICITPKLFLNTQLRKHPTWLWSLIKERWRLAQSGRKLDQESQDASKDFFG